MKKLKKLIVSVSFQIEVNIIGLPDFHKHNFSYKEYAYINK